MHRSGPFVVGLILVAGLLVFVLPVHASSGPEAALNAVEEDLSAALQVARDGRAEEGGRKVFEAFMAFESSSLHGTLAAEHPDLYQRLETEYMAFREDLRQGAPVPELEERHGLILSLHDRVRARLGEAEEAGASFGSVFLSSFMIIFREGLEAILVIAAMLAYLAKVGASGQRRILYGGAGLAVVVSLLLAVAAQWVFTLGAVQREVLEGVTMLLATVVLFYVSYWLISKVKGERWQEYIETKVDESLDRGSSLLLGVVAFVVVFREGLETVLFYQALAFSSGASLLGGGGLVGGFVVGTVVLVGVGYAIIKSSVRLPLKPFFVVTSAFLYYLAFKFAGDGMTELQEAGLVPVHYLSFMPRFDWLQTWLGVYPSLPPLMLQMVLVLLLVVGLVYSFSPRRLSPSG